MTKGKDAIEKVKLEGGGGIPDDIRRFIKRPWRDWSEEDREGKRAEFLRLYAKLRKRKLVCEEMGISHNDADHWLREDEELKKAYEALQVELKVNDLEDAQEALRLLANNDKRYQRYTRAQVTALIVHLKALAPGTYIEEVAVKHSGAMVGAPVKITMVEVRTVDNGRVVQGETRREALAEVSGGGQDNGEAHDELPSGAEESVG